LVIGTLLFEFLQWPNASSTPSWAASISSALPRSAATCRACSTIWSIIASS